ncbi:MAG: VOC family protein [Pseudomonadota bacterium]
MDYETISADAFGASLRGLGLNLLVRDVVREVAFLTDVMGLSADRVSADFAIMTYGDQVFQLHADRTYSQNALLGLMPELPPRGAGVELRLYDTDPDLTCARAVTKGAEILAKPADKPHGLREAYILSPDGYAWVPSRPLD